MRPGSWHRRAARWRQLLGAALAVALLGGLLAPAAEAGASTAAADPPEQCALEAGPDATREHEGVTDLSRHLRADEDLDAVMLFVDFDDAVSDDTPAAYRDRLAAASDWFADSSLGRISLDIDAELQWFRMPEDSTHYGIDPSMTFEDHRAYLADAVAVADDEVDLSGYELLYVVSPETATAISHSPAFVASPGQAIEADGHDLRFGANIGTNVYQRPDDREFRVLVHETGHTLGLPDLYAYTGTPIHRFVGGWDVMGNDQGDAPDLLAWHKRKLGWLDADQLACLGDGDQLEADLTPVEVPGGTKAIAVRTGEYTAHVAELRSTAGVDTDACTEGVLIYEVDANQPSGEGPVRLATADGSTPASQCGADSEAFALGPGRVGAFYDPDAGVAFEIVEETAGAVTVRANRQVQEPPVADAGGPYLTDEGDEIELDASRSSDPNTGDRLTYEWDLDGDGSFDDAVGETTTYTQVGRDRIRDIALRVTDLAGATDADETTLTVDNAAPTVELDAPVPVEEGQQVEVTGTIEDPGWLDRLDVTVDWGAGAGTTLDVGQTSNFPPTATLEFTAHHIYGDDGTFEVEVCGQDDDVSTCETVTAAVGNVDPTATIDRDGTVELDGRPVLLIRTGEPVELSGRAADPGSDDLELTWDFGDDQETSRSSLVNPPDTDGPSSPTVQPREVTDTVEHTYGSACAYTVTFTASDDDGAAADDRLSVIAADNADQPRGAGYWRHEMAGNGRTDLDAVELRCHLDAVDLLSRVFHESRDGSTPEAAHEVLHVAGNGGQARQLLDRQLLTAWLNVTSGALGLGDSVDTDGDGTPDIQVGDLLTEAEGARLDADATRAEQERYKDLLEHLNTAD